MIDLRSDTVTRPTPEMRAAMAQAEVNDAVIDTDPTAERLEQRTAALLGKEAGIFMPSGSMTNQIAIRLHCDRGSEFICEADAHVYHYEQAAFAQLSGLVARTVAGDEGVIQVKHLQGLVRPENDHMVRTRLLCLENTHNRWGGRVMPQDEVERVCAWATKEGLKKHLDGARIWNAAVTTGLSERELAGPFDSVSVCFSKGLGAPVGSVLVGPRDFIREARRARKLFGGAMRQVGIIAAGALYALENNRERLIVDHEAARRLGDAISGSEWMRLRGGRVDSNIVIIDLDPRFGTAAQLIEKLAEQEIACFAIGPQAIRMVTHLDVSSSQIDRCCEVFSELARTPSVLAT